MSPNLIYISNTPYCTISVLIRKLCVFWSFYSDYLPYDVQNCTWSSKNSGKNKGFEYYFLIVCRYLNIFFPHFIASRTFISCYTNNNFEHIMGTQYIFSFNFAWKGTLLSYLKGNNPRQTYNIRIKVWNVETVCCDVLTTLCIR